MFQNYVIEELINFGVFPQVVRDGKRIFLLEIKDAAIKFLRSNNYWPGNEDELAKQFNIEYEKTFFPTFFNQETNFDYCGEIPNEDYFFEFSDSTTIRNEKSQFISNHKNQIWCFSKELFKSCDNKVLILLKASLKYLNDSLVFQKSIQINNDKKYIHPFASELCTIAGFVYKMFRFFYLNQFEIYAVKNEFGCNGKEVSLQEYEWACFQQHKFPNLEYRSAFSHPNGQKYFLETIPDLYSEISKEALFYCGCFYHGHFENCLINPNATPNTNNPVLNKTYLKLNEEFEKKVTNLLLKHPNEIDSIKIFWECQYLKSRNSDECLKQFLENDFKVRPLLRLSPRSSVRGGYLECFALKFIQSENPSDVFYCLDINGLYSYVAIKNVFMTGPYEILIGSSLNKVVYQQNHYVYKENDLQYSKMYGTMLITILPPQNLFIPFLQIRLEDGTCVNTLCYSCAKIVNKKPCCHSEKERALTAVYFISEINFAIQLGYKVIEIYECHFFRKAEFILKDFVQILNCLKIRNSNCLEKFSSLEDKLEYCNFLNESMDLKSPFNLTPANICDNSRLKTFYKLSANSLFGKLEQKNNRTKTKFVSTQNELEDIFFSNDEIESIISLNENCCQIEVKPNTLKQTPNRQANCYIGGQLTAYARQTIYENIESISKVSKLFYVDTDCIFFSMPKNETIPLPISDAVGHFKHVYPGEILSFFALGPKNYQITYKTLDNKLHNVTKVRGFSLSSYFLENEINADLFNFYLSQYLNGEIERKNLSQLRIKKSTKRFKTDSKLELIQFSNQVTTRRTIAKNCKYLTTFPYGSSAFP